MAVQARKNSRRELLLRRGIEELNRYGLSNFSMRRVAESCGVTHAAITRHFGNRSGYIAAIIDGLNAEWSRRQADIMQTCPDDSRQLLVEFSIAYVTFLVENPHLRSILFLRDDDFDNAYHPLKSQMTGLTQQLVARYCSEVQMPDDVRVRKLYVVRALIYGAALMFDNGELPYNEENLAMVRANIDREFDLP